MRERRFPKSRKHYSLNNLEKVPYEQSIPCYLEKNKDLLVARENARESERMKTREKNKNIIVGGPLDICSSTSSVVLRKENTENLVEERTQKIFEKLNHCIKSNGLLDITKLAYSFNFEIVEHKGLPDLLNGMITCDINGNQMAINNNLSKEYKRYAIAYLLSTYLLYYQKQEFFSFKHLGSDEDLEASNMARLLLIPESILKTICPDCNENVQWLADMFEVPYYVMEQRIKEIKKSKGSVLTKKPTPSRNTENK